MLTDSPSGRDSSLAIRRREKENKYAPLIDDIKSTWNADASLYVIVISSLGAIPNETVSSLKKIFGTKSRTKVIAKRCVIVAIHGSWAIFFGKEIGPPRSYDIVP